MSPFPRGVILCLLGFLLFFAPSRAQDTASPVNLAKAFSANTTVMGEGGSVMKQKIFTSDGKVRAEVSNPFPMVIILRPDQQKIYSVIESQKAVMAMPYDPQHLQQEIALATGLDGSFETLGPQSIQGIACTEYKFTSRENKIYDLWVDNAQKIPVKMSARDGSFTLLFSDYQPGPQSADLFEIPTGYKIMEMPLLNLPSGIPSQP
jgi:outer membrane lipoprotein-sorting protein